MEKIAKAQESQVIAIDGKTHLWRSEENGEKNHLVSAFATKDGLILGQEKVCDKSNDITAIPKL